MLVADTMDTMRKNDLQPLILTVNKRNHNAMIVLSTSEMVLW